MSEKEKCGPDNRLPRVAREIVEDLRRFIDLNYVPLPYDYSEEVCKEGVAEECAAIPEESVCKSAGRGRLFGAPLSRMAEGSGKVSIPAPEQTFQQLLLQLIDKRGRQIRMRQRRDRTQLLGRLRCGLQNEALRRRRNERRLRRG